MDTNLNFQYHTFGCKVNTYDTGLIQKKMILKTNGYPVHILNTCAVTQEATKQAVKLIRKLKAKDPISTIVVTGCAAQVDTQQFEAIPAVDLVVANSHKHELPEIMNLFFKKEIKNKVFKGNIFRKEDLGVGGGEEKEHTRSFLKIQDGCNSFCSYCIIPYARGTSRSLAASHLVSKINEIHNHGVLEVVLTGVHIGDYYDAKSNLNLDGLLSEILKKTKIPRIRLTSLEPVEITEALIEIFKSPRICPHFHMSIQSANTEVLKEMKRNYTQNEVKNTLLKIKEFFPESFVGMDVIVGFPNENKERFQDTFQVLKNLPWNRLHVFPYSERTGTKAAVMTEIVPMAERKQRAEALRELSYERLLASAHQQVHKEKKVLIMKNKVGLSPDYWNVQIPEASEFLDSWVGEEVKVKIIGFDEKKNQQDVVLIGELIESA
ncbi:MAG: tRNA (N(6)-L-threonylcarbamoyladenosine(37)-C(2))-methylthiotransferase MtaB [Deltaproteobacteria bacterium]|nr:tRNA (N(6)-L-threonylcarbamoyladenosine(37)-C(2))-methylthiotransferase MtaB [Deltaproteobacteria bacterium]